MSDTQTEPTVEPTFDDGAEQATPNEPVAAETNIDAGAPEATQAAVEQDPTSSTTTDQPTTEEPVDPTLEEAPAKPAPAVPTLPPELEAVAKDAQKLQHLVHLEKLHGRQAAELGQLRQVAKQWEGLDRQQVDQILKEREQAAKVANLKPWNRGHPQNTHFARVRDGIARDMKRLERVPFEQREALRQQLLADYTPEQVQQYEEYNKWRAEEDAMTPEDREDRYREMARTEARQEIEALLKYQDQSRRTQEFMTQHGDLIKNHRDVFETALDPNIPRSQLAAEIASLKAQLAAATGERAKNIKVVETARAQTQQSQRAAAVARDVGTPRRKADPVQEALKKAQKAGPGYDPFDDLIAMQEEPEDH